MLLLLIAQTFVTLALANCNDGSSFPGMEDCKYPIEAEAILVPGVQEGLTGYVKFRQEKPGIVVITGEIKGLSDGKHGFHIHEKGDLGNKCSNTGSHYNPWTSKPSHGAREDDVEHRHNGDLGNIISKDGIAQININDEKQVKLCGGYSSIGRAFVVHAKEDDLGRGSQPDSKTTGAAGARQGCGVIQVKSPGRHE